MCMCGKCVGRSIANICQQKMVRIMKKRLDRQKQLDGQNIFFFKYIYVTRIIIIGNRLKKYNLQQFILPLSDIWSEIKTNDVS